MKNEPILSLLQQQQTELLKEFRRINQRLLSIETWLAALSKNKDLYASPTFVKDIYNLSERKNPTIEMG